MKVPEIILLTPREAARQAVTEVAPAELEVFELVSEPYLMHPRRMRRAITKRSDEALGIGSFEVSELITPAVVIVANTVLTGASQDAYQAMKPAALRVVKRLGWMLLRPWRPGILNKEKKEPRIVVTITDMQLNKIRRAGVRRAKALGVDSGRANAVVDAVLAACLETDK